MSPPRAWQRDAERIRIQLRLTRKNKKRLDHQATNRTVSVNYLIEKAVEQALDEWEKEKV